MVIDGSSATSIATASAQGIFGVSAAWVSTDASATHVSFFSSRLASGNASVFASSTRALIKWLTIVLLLGVSTGYIGCMCLSLAAERGTTAAQKEMAGMVSSFALMVGLSAGSALGLALSNFIAPNAAPSLPPPPIT